MTISKLIFILLFTLLVLQAQVLQAETEKLIQINAEIVEVDINKTVEYGIKWISDIRTQESSIPSIFSLGDFSRLNQVYGDIRLLMNNGAADLLANPKLVTKNATSATFNAGGEFPYIVTNQNGAINVQFKPYGVNLKIKPTIKQNDDIDLEVEAEVSSIDESLTVIVNNNAIPALLTRKVQSELNIKSGTTITLAGLNQTRKETRKIGIPLLGEIPVLGALFSWHKIINKKTSIVIFVTPSILQ